MSAKTKIVVVKAKELIYTALFICLGIVLIALLFFMFAPEGKNVTTSARVGTYVPGVYTSTLTLGETLLDVAVTVDRDRITSVSLNNLTDSVSAMYPLLEPSLEEINSQLAGINSIDELQPGTDNKYTSIVLKQAIKNALEKAKSQE